MNTLFKSYTRRDMLKLTASLAGSMYCVPLMNLFNSPKDRSIHIGACDWSIGKTADIKAFELAGKIGLDGVQVSLLQNEHDSHLLQKDVQKAYKLTANKYGVKIGGLALGILNQIPYKSDPRAEKWVNESIDVAAALDCEVILVAFFGDGDIKGDKEGTKEVIKRLKKVAPKAEEKNVILGIESWLSATEHMEIINAVGSKNVKVYYDVANSHRMGYNIYEEIHWLGDNICEFHAKENGYLLGQGEIDFKEVQRVIDKIGYTGWIQIEGSIPNGSEIFDSYVSNVEYMKSLF